MSFPPNPASGGGGIAINNNHFFADTDERDTYFTAHPDEEVIGTIIKIGDDYQQYDGSEWTNATIMVRGGNHAHTHTRDAADPIFMNPISEDWRFWESEEKPSWKYGLVASSLTAAFKKFGLHPEDMHMYDNLNNPREQGQFMTMGVDPSPSEVDWSFASDLGVSGNLSLTWASLSGYSIRQYIPPTEFANQRNPQIRITVQIPAGTVLSRVSIGSAILNQTTVYQGCNTNVTPVEVKFNGGSGINNSSGISRLFVSDPITIGGNILASMGLIVIFDVQTGTLPYDSIVGDGAPAWASYYKAATTSYNQSTVTGFSVQQGRLCCIRQIQFLTSTVWRRIGLCTTGPINLYVHKDASIMPWMTRSGVVYETGFASIQDAINSLPLIILHPVTIWVRDSTTEYRETVTIPRTIFSTLTIRGEHFSYGPCLANSTANRLVCSPTHLQNVEVGDFVHIVQYSGAIETVVPSQGYWGTVTNVDNKASGYVTISMDASITPTTNWTFSICRTKVSGANSGETPARTNAFELSDAVGNGSIHIVGLMVKNTVGYGISANSMFGEINIDNCMFQGCSGINMTKLLNLNVFRCGFKVAANNRALYTINVSCADIRFNTIYGLSATTAKGIEVDGVGYTYSRYNVIKGTSTGIVVGSGQKADVGANRIVAGVVTGITAALMSTVLGTATCTNNATTPKSPASGAGVVYMT